MPKTKTKTKIGRPSTRTKIQEDQIFKILSIGLSERTAAEFAGVKWGTFASWKKREEDFATKIAQKKANAKTFVAGRLYEEIQGEKEYDPKAEKNVWIRRPNITAMIFWLKTRAKEEFTEREEIEVTELPNGFTTKRI